MRLGVRLLCRSPCRGYPPGQHVLLPGSASHGVAARCSANWNSCRSSSAKAPCGPLAVLLAATVCQLLLCPGNSGTPPNGTDQWSAEAPVGHRNGFGARMSLHLAWHVPQVFGLLFLDCVAVLVGRRRLTPTGWRVWVDTPLLSVSHVYIQKTYA